MGIYFRDILLIRISRGANNCGQHSLEKNSYFTMRFSPHSQLFYFNDRLEFCEFFEWKIKRINNADLFSQLPLLIFIKGANISGGHCKYILISWHTDAPAHTLVITCWRSFIQMLIIQMAQYSVNNHIIMAFYIDCIHTDICEQSVITCWLSAIQMLIIQIQAHSPQNTQTYMKTVEEEKKRKVYLCKKGDR